MDDLNAGVSEKLGDLGDYCEDAGEEPLASILQHLGGLHNYRFNRDFGHKAYTEAMERIAEAVAKEAEKLPR